MHVCGPYIGTPLPPLLQPTGIAGGLSIFCQWRSVQGIYSSTEIAGQWVSTNYLSVVDRGEETYISSLSGKEGYGDR